MVPRVVRFGFLAEYLSDSPAYDEYEKFLRIELPKRSAALDPSFGRVSRFDPHANAWQYSFLLKGDVPEAASLKDAEEKARRLTRELAGGLKRAHANPGGLLPEPRIRVWEWQPATGGLPASVIAQIAH